MLQCGEEPVEILSFCENSHCQNVYFLLNMLNKSWLGGDGPIYLRRNIMTVDSQAIGLVAVCKSKPDMIEETRKVLLPTVAWATAKEGCVDYTLSVDRDKPEEFVFYEVWKDRAALEDHWASEGFKTLVAKLDQLLIERSTVTLLERIA